MNLKLKKLRKRIDTIDKKIFFSLLILKNCRYDKSFFKKTKKKSDVSHISKLCIKKVAKAKKILESEQKTVYLLEKDIKQRINILRKIKKIKDEIFNKISKDKRYIDKKREKEILKNIELACENNSAQKKDFLNAFKLILKMTKKCFRN